MSPTHLPFSQFFGQSKKLTPRRLLRMLHLYSGLLCSGYFILIGLSSISLNHRDTIVAPPTTNLSWESTITGAGSEAGNAELRVRRISEWLGLTGRTPRWRIEEGSGGDLSFFVWLPGRSYQVAYSGANGQARVDETREGVWGVLRNLHSLPHIDELKSWSRAWWIYNELSLATVFLALVSGAILWWPRIRERRTGLVATTVGLVICFLLMLAVWE